MYMRPPLRLATASPNKLRNLRESLYGMRQAPNQRFAKLSSKLSEYGFVKSCADYSLFTYHMREIFLALLFYLDDIILARNNTWACQDFKTYLNSYICIKDLGSLNCFLGIEVARGPLGLFLCQQKYDLEIMDECDLLGG